MHTDPSDQLRLALQHHGAGRLPEAERLYRNLLTQWPEHVEAMHYLGVLCAQTGRNDAGVDLINRAIALKPNFAEAYSNLGNILQNQGKPDAAIAALRRAVELNPGLADAYWNLGNGLWKLGRVDDAIATYHQLISLSPNAANVHFNLGCLLETKGQFAEAANSYRNAVAIQPKFPSALNNLGNALMKLGQLEQAINALRQATAGDPNLVEARFNLGNALREQGQFDEAIAAYRQVLAMRPTLAGAYQNLGMAFGATGQLDEAIAALRQMETIGPGAAGALSNLPFLVHFHPDYDGHRILQECRHWSRQHAEALAGAQPPHANGRDPQRRLKVGYVSPDFYKHCQSIFTSPLFRCHDHRHFEIFCYSDVSHPDELTAQLKAFADTWRDTHSLSDEQLSAQIGEDRIDILVDLTMHMGANRLLVFARKPAPVQVSWLAYPGTTGVSAIDYRISDVYLDPPEADLSCYSEQTICLPETFWCYDPLELTLPVGPLPAMKNGFVTFGCLNDFCKVNEGVLHSWADVLLAVPSSRLFILSPVGKHRDKLLGVMKEKGIDAGRIEFTPRLKRQKYMENYYRIDIGLDTFPYNGHTTSLDGYWMGVPVITLVGTTVAGRAGLSQLKNLGMPEWIARTPEELVRTAVTMCGDLVKLAELRANLRARMEASPLMDAPRFAHNMEAAYRQMWRTWCEGAITEKDDKREFK